MGNRDLDLPTQQQLLAQYRCDELFAVGANHEVNSAYCCRPRICIFPSPSLPSRMQ